MIKTGDKVHVSLTTKSGTVIGFLKFNNCDSAVVQLDDGSFPIIAPVSLLQFEIHCEVIESVISLLE